MRSAAKAAGVPLDVPWCDLPARAQQEFIQAGTAASPASAASSPRWNAKSTSSTSASCLPNTAATPSAPIAAGRACALKPAPSVQRQEHLRGHAPSPSLTPAVLRLAQLSPDAAGDRRHDPRRNPPAPRLSPRRRPRVPHARPPRSTLSGGESQRIQLATSLGSRLVGALYVLDEPSIGLHPRDTARLIHILQELRDLGNTILVVEHDPDVIRSADHLLDLGPGAGEFGGKLLAEGTVAEIEANPDSITGRYLTGQLSHPRPRPPPRARPREASSSNGARANNLRRARLRNSPRPARRHHRRLRLRQIHARPPGSLSRRRQQSLGQSRRRRPLQPLSRRSPARAPQRCRPRRPVPHRPHPALQPRHLHQGLRPHPRTLRRPARSQAPRLTAGHFSFNVPGGRCDTCEGDGTVTVEMQFLADVELPCEDCNGTRYKPAHPRGAVQRQEHS